MWPWTSQWITLLHTTTVVFSILPNCILIKENIFKYLFINTLRNFSSFFSTMLRSIDNKLQSLAAIYWKLGSVIDWKKSFKQHINFIISTPQQKQNCWLVIIHVISSIKYDLSVRLPICIVTSPALGPVVLTKIMLIQY